MTSKGLLLNLTILTLATVACLSCTGPSPQASNGATNSQTSVNPDGDFSYKVPDGWITEKPSSSMRAAQYVLPKVEGDPEDASLVLFYFGRGQGGSVEDNLARWIGQLEQPDGAPSKQRAKTETRTINGLKVTTLGLAGTYTAEMMPGSGSRQNKPGYRLRGAIVETPKGSYFAKLIGPEKTVARWDQSINEYFNSFEFK